MTAGKIVGKPAGPYAAAFTQYFATNDKPFIEVTSKLEKFRRALKVGGLTFIVAVLVTLFSTGLAEFVSIPIALVILAVIVFIGIIFDLIGVAATAAELPPLNAKAAKKVFGAKKALYLVKHADVVASFSCDIVGDICGTISGALGAVIVLRMNNGFHWNENLLEIIILALIAAFTVGGKAYGKRVGITRANDIMFLIGKALATIEHIFSFRWMKEYGGEERWLSLKRLMTRKTSKD